eukprot:Skav232572  [mRNA]  locus=scaffold1594:261799:262233:+ [translate_table: standard]
MRHTASSSHRQVKALFFILLLAGHDAVRVGQEVEWSKSKWNQLHADCSWSLVKGCSEGCVRKRMPLDLTPGESCRHTNAYLLENQGLENYHAMIEILIEQSQENLAENFSWAASFADQMDSSRLQRWFHTSSNGKKATTGPNLY